MFQLRQYATLGSGIPTLLVSSIAFRHLSFPIGRTTVGTGSRYALTMWRSFMRQRTASPWFRSIRASGISSDRLQVGSSSPFTVLDVRSADPDVPQVHRVEPSRVWRFRSTVVSCSKPHPQCIETAIPQGSSLPETISLATKSSI